MQQKFIRRTVLGCLSIVMAAGLTSCNDNTLARAMDGTWKGRITTHYEDQSKEYEDVYVQFNYVESDEKDGGTYIDVRDINAKDIDLDDTKLDVHYTMYIEGEWQVLGGMLSMKPDVSTLKVNVNSDDIKMNYQNVGALLGDFEDNLYSLGESRRELASSIQKTAYSDHFQKYKMDEDNADNEAFDDLDVKDGVMSFTAEDVGKTTLRKVKVNVQDIYGSHSSK